MTAPGGPPSGGGNAPTNDPKGSKKERPIHPPRPPKPDKPEDPGNEQE